jgi:type VI protein secretion system component Hcp
MDDTKKQPEEITDVPLTESELDKAVGGDKTSVSHEGFVIVKPVDIASPKLYD